MDPGYQPETPALLSAAVVCDVRSQAVMFKKAKLKSSCTSALYCETTRQTHCFALRKAHLLIKYRKHFQQCCLLGKSQQHCYLLELALIT